VGCGFDQVRGAPYDLVINATSAGLQREMPALPATLVNEESICYDMAYGRSDTPFIEWARSQHAASAVKGWGMLVEQAAESFLLWSGRRPKTQPVLEALAGHG